MIMNYGNTFVKWRANSLDVWTEFTEHKFVNGLKNGTLEEKCFVRYLRQDYIFLLNFSRAWALAIVKTDNLEEMRMAANLVNALLNEELQLHVKICQKKGISEDELQKTAELSENMAYTRYVLEAGFSGSFLDLMASLAPCVMGYGEIGAKLKVEKTSEKYSEWINTYSGSDYQNLCSELGNVIDNALISRLGENCEQGEQWKKLIKHFRQATTLESKFWEMGLNGE